MADRTDVIQRCGKFQDRVRCQFCFRQQYRPIRARLLDVAGISNVRRTNAGAVREITLEKGSVQLDPFNPAAAG